MGDYVTFLTDTGSLAALQYVDRIHTTGETITLQQGDALDAKKNQTLLKLSFLFILTTIYWRKIKQKYGPTVYIYVYEKYIYIYLYIVFFTLK